MERVSFIICHLSFRAKPAGARWLLVLMILPAWVGRCTAASARVGRFTTGIDRRLAATLLTAFAAGLLSAVCCRLSLAGGSAGAALAGSWWHC